MAYKLNNVLFSVYGIIPGRMDGEGIAVKGIFDLPKRIGQTYKDWAESNGVEPYVDADEIFFGSRVISFQGIILGDVSTIKAYLNAFKVAVDAFTDVVPLETPYGNACVYVSRLTPTFLKGGAKVLIEFIEPVVGASCSISSEETVYDSGEYSETAIKNNCAAGYHGSEVELTSELGKFTSTVSQNAADLLAIQWVRENKQDYANANGTCIIDPPKWYNAKLTGTLQKNDCGPGLAGTDAVYEVPAYKYSSLISQEDADAQAQAELDSNLTQAYANSNGSCVAAFWNSAYTFYRTKNDCPSGQIGSKVYYTVPAYTFSSLISQIDADLDAANFAFFEFTQADANAQGTCSLPEVSSVTNLGLETTWQYGYKRKWQINPTVKIGSKFIFIAYGVTVEYTVQTGDTALSIANTLVMFINNYSAGDWGSQNMFPSGVPTPFAKLESSSPVVISVKLEMQSNFNLYVQN